MNSDELRIRVEQLPEVIAQQKLACPKVSPFCTKLPVTHWVINLRDCVVGYYCNTCAIMVAGKISVQYGKLPLRYRRKNQDKTYDQSYEGTSRRYPYEPFDNPFIRPTDPFFDEYTGRVYDSDRNYVDYEEIRRKEEERKRDAAWEEMQKLLREAGWGKDR